MKRFLRQSAAWLDDRLAPVYLRFIREEAGVPAFVFHALYRDDAVPGRVHPRYAAPVAFLERFLTCMIDAGYRFITLRELEAGAEGERQAVLTFDDGYAGIREALPVLARLGIPAVCFVSTAYVGSGDAFWWDVVYRERSRQGMAPAAIEAELRGLAALPPEVLRERLAARFGAAALRPEGDEDRPLSPDELIALARTPGIEIGNHTRDHVVLRFRTPDERREQILGAQADLKRWLGAAPGAFAYPDGAFTRAVAADVAALGFSAAFTVEPRKIHRPVRGEDRFLLGRFSPRPPDDPARACRRFRAGTGLMRAYLSLGRTWHRLQSRTGA